MLNRHTASAALLLSAIHCTAGAMEPPPEWMRPCFRIAASLTKTPEPVLWAIAWQESRYRQSAVNVNDNGTRDVGVMQINTSWKRFLTERGIPWEYIERYACVNIMAGSYILLVKRVETSNDLLAAIAKYHSPRRERGHRYAKAIVSHMEKLARSQQHVVVGAGNVGAASSLVSATVGQ